MSSYLLFTAVWSGELRTCRCQLSLKLLHHRLKHWLHLPQPACRIWYNNNLHGILIFYNTMCLQVLILVPIMYNWDWEWESWILDLEEW